MHAHNPMQHAVISNERPHLHYIVLLFIKQTIQTALIHMKMVAH